MDVGEDGCHKGAGTALVHVVGADTPLVSKLQGALNERNQHVYLDALNKGFETAATIGIEQERFGPPEIGQNLDVGKGPSRIGVRVTTTGAKLDTEIIGQLVQQTSIAVAIDTLQRSSVVRNSPVEMPLSRDTILEGTITHSNSSVQFQKDFHPKIQHHHAGSSSSFLCVLIWDTTEGMGQTQKSEHEEIHKNTHAHNTQKHHKDASTRNLLLRPLYPAWAKLDLPRWSSVVGAACKAARTNSSA